MACKKKFCVVLTYTFTLESGFPDEAVRVVLSSIKNLDRYIAEMRPAIDGTTAAVPSASR